MSKSTSSRTARAAKRARISNGSKAERSSVRESSPITRKHHEDIYLSWCPVKVVRIPET